MPATSALVEPEPRKHLGRELLASRRQWRRQVVDVAGRRLDLAGSAKAVESAALGKRREQRYRATPVRDFDGVALLDEPEELACPLAQFSDPDTSHGLLVAHRSLRYQSTKPCPVALSVLLPGEVVIVYTNCTSYILWDMAKHLIDIDEQALKAARAELGTRTIRDTVNESLSRAAGRRSAEVTRCLDRLARLKLDDRGDAWR